MSGLGTQVSGTHYTSMKMQPVQLAYMLHATPCFCKLAKYLTRNKGDKLENLKKALHCIRLEQDLIEYADVYLNPFQYCTTYGEDLIKQFTDNDSYRKALLHLYNQNYESAILTVEDIIRNYQEVI